MARPRSDAWLWILNAVVIGTVIIAAAAAATTTGHTVVAGTDHFLLYYAGVLALIALTAEVGIGLVASDRIFMKPSARVTAQALHRAMGFGAIAFLVIHIVLEIIAGRSQPADTVIPFLDKGRTFYLGLGTVASDMFIVIMMTGIYRARLAANMSPKAWRVIHASAYAAWIFGLVHGLLAGRPAKSFFGFSGFVAWSYGACVVAVAAALMVRLVAKNRAGNELASHPVADSGGSGGWSAAAAALAGSGALPGAAALTATAMPAQALPAGSPGALDGARSRASRTPGRAQLALPAGASAASQGGRGRSAPYDERAAYLAENRRMGASGPIGPGGTGSFERGRQFGGPGADPRDWASEYEPTGPMPRVAQHGQTGPVPRVAQHGQTGPMPRVAPHEQTGPMPRAGQYEQGGYQYERTGQIDRSGQYERPQPGQLRPRSQQPGQTYGDPMPGGQMPGGQMPGGQMPGGREPAGQVRYGPPAPSPMLSAPPAPVQYGQPMSRQYGETGPYERPHDDWSGPMERIGPSAMAPRYAAGNYNDWSGPLERIDPAAPPSQYGAPAHYDSLAQYGPGQYGTGGQYGGTGHHERPQAEPRYERTGEIDRSGQTARPSTARPSTARPSTARPRTASHHTDRRPASLRTAPLPRSTAGPGTDRPRTARKVIPVSRWRDSANGPARMSGRHRPSTSSPAGTSRGASPRRPCSTRSPYSTRSPCSTTSTSTTTNTSVDRAARAAGQVSQASTAGQITTCRSALSITPLSLSRTPPIPGRVRPAPAISSARRTTPTR